MNLAKAYAAALGALAVFTVVPMLPLQGGTLIDMQAAGPRLHYDNWYEQLAAPLARAVLAGVLIGIATLYVRGWLNMPVTIAARVGRTLAIGGLVGVFVSLATIIAAGVWEPEAWFLVSFGPANLWASFLCAGISMVEGSRIHMIARVRRDIYGLATKAEATRGPLGPRSRALEAERARAGRSRVRRGARD